MDNNLEIFPSFSEKNKKIFLFMGIFMGLVTLWGGIDMSFKGVLRWEQAFVISLTIFLYFSNVPRIMNTCVRLIRPVFMKFERLCKKNNIEYEIVMGRSIRIVFAEGTKWSDRCKFGLRFELILFLQMLTFIFGFSGILMMMTFLIIFI